MKRFEYKCETASIISTKLKNGEASPWVVERLNEWGQDGWQVVGVITEYSEGSGVMSSDQREFANYCISVFMMREIIEPQEATV